MGNAIQMSLIYSDLYDNNICDNDTNGSEVPPPTPLPNQKTTESQYKTHGEMINEKQQLDIWVEFANAW
jgi:hypothetical protein